MIFWTKASLLVASTAFLSSVASSVPMSSLAPAVNTSIATHRVQTQDAFFVRAGAEGARVLNFQDANASPVRQADAGTLMRVTKTDVGFHNVEVAGGLQVWVHGKFLETTGTQGVLRCSAWGVLMRPGPADGVEYMPITVKLQRGDLVRQIELADAALPMAQTWVKVWSPPHARGWVKESQTVKVSDAVGAKDEWKKLAATNAARIAVQSTTEASAAVPANAEVMAPEAKPATEEERSETALALDDAETLFAAAQAKDAGFAPVVSAYEKVIAIAASGSTSAVRAAQGLKQARLHLQIEQLEADAVSARAAEQEKLELLRLERERVDLKGTQHWGRFTERGWVQVEKIAGETRYFLYWGGEMMAEIQCSTGRYDLGVLKNFEIGVQAVMTRPAMPAREATFNRGAMDSAPQILDITRIEVISARR
ncbi:MAG: hypothetical protein ACI841_001453 [Planctomycetota bacterium]|jgi:hypothetical protein